MPTSIIEVNDTIIESFLGRIEDPEKSKNTILNIVNDPAFRTLMVVKIKNKSLRTSDINPLQAAIRGYTKAIKALTTNHNGGLVRSEANTYLMSFALVSDAIHCAKDILNSYNKVVTPDLEFKIGLSAGIPVTDKDGIFENTIKTSDYLSDIAKGDFTITSVVKDFYESENQNKSIEHKSINVIKTKDEDFLMQLMSITEKIWFHSTTSVSNFEENLGYSKSKLYRMMMNLVGKSPNIFFQNAFLKNMAFNLPISHEIIKLLYFN